MASQRRRSPSASDGRKAIDCPYDQGPIELSDVDILPLDGMISIRGSYADRHVAGLISLPGNEIVNAPWLERHAR